MDLLGVTHIDLVNHAYEATIKVQASWTDPTLEAAECPQGVADPDMWPDMVPYERPSERDKKRWCPALHMTNLLEVKTREVWYTVYRTKHDIEEERLRNPVVCFNLRMRATFSESFEMHHFPFDRQNLQLKIQSHKEIHPHIHPAMPLTDLADRDMRLLEEEEEEEGEEEEGDKGSDAAPRRAPRRPSLPFAARRGSGAGGAGGVGGVGGRLGDGISEKISMFNNGIKRGIRSGAGEGAHNGGVEGDGERKQGDLDDFALVPNSNTRYVR